MPGRRLVTIAMPVVTMMVLACAVPAGAGAAQAGDEAIDHRQWASAAEFGAGELAGLTANPNGLRIDKPIGTVERTEPELGTTRTYEYGQWSSPKYEQGFDATELIASWNAHTPPNTWMKVEAQGHTSSGDDTAWYDLGEWAHGDADIHRTSVDGQDDTHASVNTDTVRTKPGVTLHSYQLRVSLFREAGSSATPTVRSVGAMTSHVPDRFEVPVTAPGEAAGTELPVPRYSQNIHKGQYPEYGGGGENWCSPTSTAMVLDYWGKGPSADELSWIPKDYPDRGVANAARHTYDYAYDGTGNWPFNTAYAAQHGLRGHITRLHSLADIEHYIASGIPVITSQSFRADELDGAGYGTAGHIMVVVGFTPAGDVIAHDPASSSDDAVRNVYPRAQFENIWQRTKRYDDAGKLANAPGGIAYVITG